MRLNIFRKQANKDNRVKKVFPLSWRKLIPGVILVGFGVFLGSIYVNDNKLILFGMIAAIFLGLVLPGLLLRKQVQNGSKENEA